MLEIEDLVFRYRGADMVYSLRAPRGDCLAIIGPSGAGKSTLLSLIAGFERAVSGSLRFDDCDLRPLTPAQRPVTTLFQEHNLFAHLTVAQNAGLGLDPGLRLNPEQTRRLDEALTEVGLESLRDRLPAQLSGGQRQRVALARSLVRDRPLLLLDEPFSALDPGLRAEMLDLVDRLRRTRELTVLMASHDLADARRIAKRTAFLHNGRVLASDDTERLLARRDLPELLTFLGPRG